MTRTILAVRALSGMLFLAQLAIGILFWTGHAMGLVTLHTFLGSLFVLGLWTLSVLCARAGAPVGGVVAVVLLGAVIPVLGMTQVRLLPGSNHWVIQVIHLVLGLVAMPLAGWLSTHVARRGPAPAVPTGLGLGRQ